MLLIFFQELNSEGLYLSSQKEKGSRCLVITSSIKREMKCTAQKRDARAN